MTKNRHTHSHILLPSWTKEKIKKLSKTLEKKESKRKRKRGPIDGNVTVRLHIQPFLYVIEISPAHDTQNIENNNRNWRLSFIVKKKPQ